MPNKVIPFKQIKQIEPNLVDNMTPEEQISRYNELLSKDILDPIENAELEYLEGCLEIGPGLTVTPLYE